jgi:hypothetical protein
MYAPELVRCRISNVVQKGAGFQSLSATAIVRQFVIAV